MAIQVAGVLLDGCVLSLLSCEDAYGYSLTQKVKSTLGVSESTLYPVMRRLQTDECLTVYDAPVNGRNRRYYKITERGVKRFHECKAEWADFKRRVDIIINSSDKQGLPYREQGRGESLPAEGFGDAIENGGEIL